MSKGCAARKERHQRICWQKIRSAPQNSKAKFPVNLWWMASTLGYYHRDTACWDDCIFCPGAQSESSWEHSNEHIYKCSAAKWAAFATLGFPQPGTIHFWDDSFLPHTRLILVFYFKAEKIFPLSSRWASNWTPLAAEHLGCLFPSSISSDIFYVEFSLLMKLASPLSSLSGFALALPNPPDSPRLKTGQKERKKKINKCFLFFSYTVSGLASLHSSCVCKVAVAKLEKKVVWKGSLNHTAWLLLCRMAEGSCLSSRNCEVLAAASIFLPWKRPKVTTWKRQRRRYTCAREFAPRPPRLKEGTAF